MKQRSKDLRCSIRRYILCLSYNPSVNYPYINLNFSIAAERRCNYKSPIIMLCIWGKSFTVVKTRIVSKLDVYSKGTMGIFLCLYNILKIACQEYEAEKQPNM